MTHARTPTICRVAFVIYRKFGERARNTRESHRQEMQLDARFIRFIIARVEIIVSWDFLNIS